MELNKAVVTYTATGRHKVIEETFYTGHNIPPNGSPSDPLAQTFSFIEDTIVIGVGIYLGTKGTETITVELRNVVNGYPGPIVYASKTLKSSEVGTSANATVETKFMFNDPILCNRDTQYCWVALTDSSEYRVWIAKMGERDVTTNEWVPAQPFIGGTLFSSNDNKAWTAHQDSDAKFNIYTADFNEDSYILNFDQLTSIEASQLVLTVSQLIPAGTSVLWEVSQNGSTNWVPLEVNGKSNKLNIKYANCYVRATLIGYNMSPIINLSAIVAVGIKFALTSKYINRNIVTLSNFTKIDIWADVHTPSGASATFKFSTNDGTSWTNATQVGTLVIDSEYTQLHFQNTVSSTSQFRMDIDFAGTEVLTAEIRRLMVTLS